MKWQVEYYKKENGKIPVLEYLLTLNAKMRAKTFSEIELLEKHGTNLREPYAKPIKGEKYKNLFELRIKFSSDISRIFILLSKTALLYFFTDIQKRLQRLQNPNLIRH